MANKYLFQPCGVITVAQHSYFTGVSVAYKCIEILTYVLLVNGYFIAKIGLLKDLDLNSFQLAGVLVLTSFLWGTRATVLCIKAQYTPIPFIYCAALDP